MLPLIHFVPLRPKLQGAFQQTLLEWPGPLANGMNEVQQSYWSLLQSKKPGWSHVQAEVNPIDDTQRQLASVLGIDTSRIENYVTSFNIITAPGNIKRLNITSTNPLMGSVQMQQSPRGTYFKAQNQLGLTESSAFNTQGQTTRWSQRRPVQVTTPGEPSYWETRTLVPNGISITHRGEDGMREHVILRAHQQGEKHFLTMAHRQRQGQQPPTTTKHTLILPRTNSLENTTDLIRRYTLGDT